MSKQTETLREKLHGRLQEMDARLQQLKTSAKAGTEEADQALHAQAARVSHGMCRKLRPRQSPLRQRPL